jgi:alpha-tubulin suppressor-like RCC1 family protein
LISAGDSHTVQIVNGALWAWGINTHGQLGNNDDSHSDSSIPVREVTQASNWVSVSVGGESFEDFPHAINFGDATPAGSGHGYTLAIKEDGTLWAWGDNRYGQLGLGTTHEHNDPQQVGSDNDWVSVSAGDSHAVAIRSDGTLWAWGRNNHGQLGDGTTTDRHAPVQIDAGEGYHWVSASAGGDDDEQDSGTAGESYFHRQHLAGHTVAIRSDGTLWTWGYNADGQLGDGTATEHHTPQHIGDASDWATVSAGNSHTIAIRDNGTERTLWGWGWNHHRQVGNGSVDDVIDTPTQITLNTDWDIASAGKWHTVAIRDNGTERTLWAWGRNYYGELGNGTTVNGFLPSQITIDTDWADVSAGGWHTVGMKSDGLLTWGDNQYGQLANSMFMEKHVPTQKAAAATGWDSISTGSDHALAIRSSDHTLWGWGRNDNGQLGNNTDQKSSVPVQEARRAINWESVTAGHEYSAAIRSDGTLWTWGHNDYGQLGYSTATAHTEEAAQVVGLESDTDWAMVASGGWHTAAIKDDGTLWLWGRNEFGQLGNGSADDNVHTTPYEVSAGDGFHWVSVSVSDNDTAAIKVSDTNITNRTLWTWGWNDSGQLGVGSNIDHHTPVQEATLATNWDSVSVSDYHMVAVKTNGELWAWGMNLYGQLGVDDAYTGASEYNVPTQEYTRADNWASVSTGDLHTVATKIGGTLWSWGHNNHGQLGRGDASHHYSVQQNITPGETWDSVSGGDFFNMAINSSGELYEWGDNEYGQVHQWVTVPTPLP